MRGEGKEEGGGAIETGGLRRGGVAVRCPGVGGLGRYFANSLSIAEKELASAARCIAVEPSTTADELEQEHQIQHTQTSIYMSGSTPHPAELAGD